MCTLKKFITRLWDKLIHAHYLHYIGVLAICASLLVTVFNYEVSIIRAADTFLDFADSLRVYYGLLLTNELPEGARMAVLPEIDLTAILPFDIHEIARKLADLYPTMFDADNFTDYLIFTLDLSNLFLLLVVPVVLLLILIVCLFVNIILTPQEKGKKRPVETKALRWYKKVTRRPYRAVGAWLRSVVAFYKDKRHRFYPITVAVVWALNLNLFTIALSVLAFYFYFVAALDLGAFFVYAVRLLTDILIMFFSAHWLFWLAFGWLLLCVIREFFGYKKLNRLERENQKFVGSLPVVSLSVGWMGKGKTELITDMALSASVMFRNNALKDMLEIDMRFPHFDFSALIQDLRQAIESREIDNLYPAGEWMKKRRAAFEEDPRSENIWGYDFTYYPMDYNDDLKIENIWDALTDYAKLFFIYFVQSSIIFANYSIREDFTYTDHGNLIYWNHDFFKRDPRKQKKESVYAKILDDDMLRLGVKMLQDNEFVGALQFGVINETEIGKNRGNQVTLKDVKKTDKECNELNDGYEDFLKVIRHLATVRYRCYAIVFADEQRASSWKADGREVAMVVKIKSKSELLLALPFFTFACAAYDFFRPRYDDFMTEYRVARKDMCLPVYLMQSVFSFFFTRHERTVNRFGYMEKELVLQVGGDEGEEKTEWTYYQSTKKGHSDRYSSDCLRGLFIRRLEQCTKPFLDIPSFDGKDATPEQLEGMHSHFVKRVNNLLGKG